MKKYAIVKQGSDYEIYLDLVRGQYVKVVWGYATGTSTGIHNLYDTDACVYRWENHDWEPIAGFNISVDKDGYVDWDDYAKKVDQVLAEI